MVVDVDTWGLRWWIMVVKPWESVGSDVFVADVLHNGYGLLESLLLSSACMAVLHLGWTKFAGWLLWNISSFSLQAWTLNIIQRYQTPLGSLMWLWFAFQRTKHIVGERYSKQTPRLTQKQGGLTQNCACSLGDIPMILWNHCRTLLSHTVTLRVSLHFPLGITIGQWYDSTCSHCCYQICMSLYDLCIFSLVSLWVVDIPLVVVGKPL